MNDNILNYHKLHIYVYKYIYKKTDYIYKINYIRTIISKADSVYSIFFLSIFCIHRLFHLYNYIRHVNICFLDLSNEILQFCGWCTLRKILS